MADEPTPRAQWNLMMFLNLGLLGAAIGVLVYGLVTKQMTAQEALGYVGIAAFGKGITWTQGK